MLCPRKRVGNSRADNKAPLDYVHGSYRSNRCYKCHVDYARTTIKVKTRRRKVGGNSGYVQCNMEGDRDLLKAVNEKNGVSVFAVMDELMEAVKVLHPRMYNSVMQKIQDL